MIRTGAPRALQRLLKTPPANLRYAHNAAPGLAKTSFQSHAVAGKRPVILALAAYRPQTSLVRYYASNPLPGTTRRPDKENKFAEQVIKPNPGAVSETSTTMPIFANEAKEEEVDMLAGIKHDVRVIRDTFALNEVPTEAYRIGLAGVLPYLATSSVTVACALNINYAQAHDGQAFFLDEAMTEQLLGFLEPIQVGYGAVILSFLGAIHWGLEWAGYGGHGGYRRYAIGVLAPAFAWPTIFLPVEHALILQFLAFNVLYAVDSNTSTKGWTPPWYATYRWVLTFIVGGSIIVTLIGRGQIAERGGTLPTAAQRLKEIGAIQTATPVEQQEGEGEEEGDE